MKNFKPLSRSILKKRSLFFSLFCSLSFLTIKSDVPPASVEKKQESRMEIVVISSKEIMMKARIFKTHQSNMEKNILKYDKQIRQEQEKLNKEAAALEEKAKKLANFSSKNTKEAKEIEKEKMKLNEKYANLQVRVQAYQKLLDEANKKATRIIMVLFAQSVKNVTEKLYGNKAQVVVLEKENLIFISNNVRDITNETIKDLESTADTTELEKESALQG